MSKDPFPTPILILVEPQLGANIGLTARAALNCGLDQIRIVRPRETWPNPSALAAAGAAADVLNNAALHDTVASATADLVLTYAATARPRNARIPVDSVEEAASRLRHRLETAGSAVGVLFGPEASGLDTPSLAHAHRILTFDTSSRYPSLNLAHAALLFCWTWRRTQLIPKVSDSGYREPSAPGEEIGGLVARFLDKLGEKDFFNSDGARETIAADLNHLLRRAEPSSREVALLHGMLSCLTSSRHDP